MTDGSEQQGVTDAKIAACHLTPADLAGRWVVSTRTLARWRSARKGPTWLRLHGRVRYRLADVLAYEREHVALVDRTMIPEPAGAGDEP